MLQDVDDHLLDFLRPVADKETQDSFVGITGGVVNVEGEGNASYSFILFLVIQDGLFHTVCELV